MELDIRPDELDAEKKLTVNIKRNMNHFFFFFFTLLMS